MGGGLNNSVNIAGGMAGPLSAWRWLAAETPLRALHGMEKYEDLFLAIAKTWFSILKIFSTLVCA
jgi:hypothetical protein